jgi:membrane-bound lytic murein transglycosylase B
MKKWVLAIIAYVLVHQVAFAQQNWNDWVAGIRVEALRQGISPEVFDEAFAGLHEPSHQIKGLSHSQPEHRLTFIKYRNTRIDGYRIAIGRKKYKQNQAVLEDIGRKYGVNPCFIVAFWGIETSYGSYMGNFPVVKALATLAYDSNRKEFFRKELFIALRILNEGHVDLADFKGEWAGASGQPQFLPSSWVKYAVDYDGDGHKDIWRSKPDAFASIANYMKLNGWRTGEPWAIQVKLPPKFDMAMQGKSIVKPVSEWNALGVRTENGQPLPYQNMQGNIVQPLGGPTFLTFPNYHMILHYNNSIYYAGSVGYLADKICEGQQR